MHGACLAPQSLRPRQEAGERLLHRRLLSRRRRDQFLQRELKGVPRARPAIPLIAHIALHDRKRRRNALGGDMGQRAKIGGRSVKTCRLGEIAAHLDLRVGAALQPPVDLDDRLLAQQQCRIALVATKASACPTSRRRLTQVAPSHETQAASRPGKRGSTRPSSARQGSRQSAGRRPRRTSSRRARLGERVRRHRAARFRPLRVH